MSNEESMTARTSDWDARTTRPEAVGHQPSVRALATRSLTAAGRLTGEARREALVRHFKEFVPPASRSCPVRR